MTWTDLAPDLRVRQSRAYRMNSVLLLHADHAVLVDPGVLPSEMDDIARAVDEAGSGRATLVFTHAHWDHVLGRTWWPATATIAHDAFGPAVRRDEHVIDREARQCMPGFGETWDVTFEAFSPDLPVRGEHPLRLGPWSLVFRDAPGHDDSQITVHLPERGVLIAADMLSDIEIPTLDRPPAVYLATLRALEPLVASGAVETLVPGHGSVARGPTVRARLARDLGYLESLAAGVHDARARGQALEDAQRALASLDFIGREAEFPMDEIHRENVRIAFESTAVAGPRA